MKSVVLFGSFVVDYKTDTVPGANTCTRNSKTTTWKPLPGGALRGSAGNR